MSFRLLAQLLECRYDDMKDADKMIQDTGTMAKASVSYAFSS